MRWKKLTLTITITASLIGSLLFGVVVRRAASWLPEDVNGNYQVFNGQLQISLVKGDDGSYNGFAGYKTPNESLGIEIPGANE